MKKSFHWISIIICCLLLIASIVIHFFPYGENPSANEIYNNCLHNVVEVKAEGALGEESYGTGEIISSDGKIVTNAHVITYTRLSSALEFESYYIRFAFEKDYREVSLEKYDIDLDIAILKLLDYSDLVLNPIHYGNSNNLHSGDKVYAIGNASNHGIGIFEGIISIPLVVIEVNNVKRNVIQCDLTIAAGNSGGALLNENGEMIVITTFRTKDQSGNVIYGIVYCIPMNIVLEYIK